MKRLHIEATKLTPEIILSPDDNVFSIHGHSSPEDVRSLYYPVIEWFEIFTGDVIEGEYVYSADKPLKFEFYLPYFNSSSAKFIFDIITVLKKLKESGIPVRIDWLYDFDDPDQKDAGEEISELAGISFNYFAIKHGE